MDNELKVALFDITQSLGRLAKRIDNLEDSYGEKATGGDGTVRVQPIPAVRASHKKVARQVTKRDGRKDSRDLGRQPRRDPQPEREVDNVEGVVDVEAKRKAEVAALDGGVHAAVASFSPPGEPTGPPSRSVEIKLLWDVDDIIPCQTCKEPVFLVRKRLTSGSKLAELPLALEPYSDKVLKLTPETPVKNIGGVWFNCPLCHKDWGVVVA